MIVPLLLTAGIIGALLYSAPIVALRDRASGSVPPLPKPTPPEPRPTPAPRPLPVPRPFAGLPYGSVVRVTPDGIVFGTGGVISEIVKVVGEAAPSDPFGYHYLAIDTQCRFPDTYCSRYSLREDQIVERLS